MKLAYDRVERIFIEKIMRKMGFCMKWVGWIKECLKSVSYSFLLDGQVEGYVKPTRGLRQGNPLSPFLFLLCSEGLSVSMLQKRERDQSFKGVRICRGGPSSSQLFFVDDTLIFGEGSTRGMESIRETLEVYGKASGQLINYGKSCCFFSKNTSVDKRENLSQLLGHKKGCEFGEVFGASDQPQSDEAQDFFLYERLVAWQDRRVVRLFHDASGKGDHAQFSCIGVA